MSHHRAFDRRVNEAIETRPRCAECGGGWWVAANRIFHKMSCSQNPLGRRPRRDKLDMPTIEDEYDRVLEAQEEQDG